jgi:hypothetical protein
MEGFDSERGSARPAPGFEPPVEQTGIPRLEADQVLDLQRTAGNRLTAGALARWTGPLDRTVAQQLLGRLLAARTADPGLYDAICAAIDGLEPRICVQLSGPPGAVAVELRGPAGAAWFADVVPATFELPFALAFGRAAEIEPEHALELTVAGHAIELPLPFADPGTAGGYTALVELR